MGNVIPDEEQPLVRQAPAEGRETFWFGMNEQLYGYFLMALSSIGFTAVSFTVHLLGSPLYSFHLPALFLVWFRSTFQFLASLLYMFTAVDDLKETLRAITLGRGLLLAARGLSGGLGFICFYSSLSILPLGDAVTIFFLAPLFTVLMTALTLGEPVTIFEAVASVISFIGVALIAKPSISPHTSHVPVSDVLKINLSDRNQGVLLALCAAFLAAVAYTLVRKLGAHIHFIYNILALGVVAMLLTTFVMWDQLASLLFASLSSPSTCFLLLAQAGCAFCGQIFLTKALQHCGGLGVMIRNVDVPLSYILGIALLGEVPTWLGTIGAALVLFATGAISFRKAVRS